MRRVAWGLAFLAAAIFWVCPSAGAVRIKDIARFMGVRTNPLFGYGLVVGLNGTGDNSKTQFTTNTLANMLDHMGIHVDPDALKVKNVAAVMVTAQLPPFARIGNRIDVQVSSIGDAKSLEGGTLLMTPLQGPDGQIYAVAQGPLSTGGFSSAGASGSSVQKNHPTVGYISGGAMVERELPLVLSDQEGLDLVLEEPDFSTANRAAQRINLALGGPFAKPVSASTIRVQVPPSFRTNMVGLISRVETLEVTPDTTAKVVINERTGTIVMGENVRISPVAVAHGNLTVQITEQPAVSQPLPLSQGQTVVTPQSSVQVQEGKGSLNLLPGGATIGEVIHGLNAIGATPRDIITILQAIKAAGALHARLELI
ncbi:flagellar P-ring protein precursor FlgI [Desulfacinum hydrothermale DSM 13146]|uniref:Flagellar P-ring protein n=1 Tax=Desulfacinum hydrothermale DSM 13146 TaxID=1121390 RepID=A0A1W1X632_9BACT|nr:flagellar basal body P-ring protein FlgI [Desulfacinum hydrothermale]SMC19385.1 flagellar P-ring protein precursor FlgI [Desulfacinum hydrothermale DSM 13146]